MHLFSEMRITFGQIERGAANGFRAFNRRWREADIVHGTAAKTL